MFEVNNFGIEFVNTSSEFLNNVRARNYISIILGYAKGSFTPNKFELFIIVLEGVLFFMGEKIQTS